MRRPSIGGIVEGLIGGALIVVLPSILGYYAERDVPWPFAVGFAVALAALGVFLTGKLRAYRRGLPLTNRHVERRLKEWAVAAGWGIRGNPQSNVLFSFAIEDEDRRIVNIIRPVDNPEHLRLASAIETSAPQLETIRGFTEERKQDLGDEIINELIRLGVGVKFIEFPRRFELTRLVDLGSIRNRTDFLNALFVIRSGTTVVKTRIRRATQVFR